MHTKAVVDVSGSEGGGGGGARVWEVFMPGEKKTYLGEGFTWCGLRGWKKTMD